MVVGPAVRSVARVGGLRMPFARAYGVCATASNQDMLTAALRAVVERFKLQGERLGDVAAGAVLKHSRDYNLVRGSVLSSGLDAHTPRSEEHTSELQSQSNLVCRLLLEKK